MIAGALAHNLWLIGLLLYPVGFVALAVASSASTGLPIRRFARRLAAAWILWTFLCCGGAFWIFEYLAR